MDLTIYTYGHIDAMFYVLSGIAMLTNHGFTDMLIKTVGLATACYYGMMAAYGGASGRHREYLVKVFAMIMMINAALVPKTEMYIVDHVSKKREKVDNLPYGFAVPVGTLEAFGELLTGGFEQAFTTVGSANYRDYGMVFGARLVQDSRNWRIKTPEFTENMDTFLRRCVIRDAMIGYNYTANDLLTSDDILQLSITKAGTLRKVAMRSDKAWELVSCKEAALSYIVPAFNSEVAALKQKKANSDFASASTSEKYLPRSATLINNMLGKNIELAFGSYLGTNKSAEQLIKQQMMINSMSNIGDDYGFARASMQQESSWRIAGDLASTYLPILLSVIKGMLYAAFMFMIPLMLLSGGGKKYMSYLTVVASLQLWPALNAILNMFIDLYSSNSLTGIANGIVSFATFSEIGNYADKIVAVASGLEMSIPFLAFAIVQGGVGGLIHLAGNITGATQSAATSVASEVATGNRSIDNISTGNMQMAMQQGFKTDLNQSYAAGASSFQHGDGTMERALPNGDTLFQSGAGMTMSGGGVKFNVRESAASQLAEHLTNAQSLMNSDQRAYSTASQATIDKTASLITNLAERESRGETIDYTKAGEHGKSMQQAVNNVKTLREQHGYGWEQELKAGIRADITASTPGKGILGFGVSGGADSSVSASNSSSQSFADENQTNRENNNRIDYSSVVKAASNEQFAKSNNIDTSYSNDIRRSYQQQQSLEGQLAARAEQVESYSKGLSQIQSKDASYEQDKYHELEQNVARAYGVSTKDAHNMIEHNDPRVLAIRQKMISDEVSQYVPAINSGQVRTSTASSEAVLDKFDQNHQSKIQQDHTAGVKEQAVASGIDPNNKQFVQDNVSHKVNNLMSGNEQKITQEKIQNEISEKQLQGHVNRYEEDRIGQGITSKILGTAAWAGSLGHTADRIGGPDNPSTVKALNGVESKITALGNISSEEPAQRAVQIVEKEDQ
jgi:hypothetical protein